MHEVETLRRAVEEARGRYLNAVRSLTNEQGAFKPEPGVWSAAENTEHLFHAEHGGINGIWRGLDGLRRGDPPWKDEHTNRGLTIEEVVAKTWKPRETVPAGAGPDCGGPLAYWVAALASCEPVLARVADELAGEDLEAVIYPHPISGPLDARQRFQFLRFHLDRHRDQIMRLKEHPEFPRGPA
jgi:hypothetical protein